MELTVTSRQYAFIKADADEVLFGGAAGGGKSYGQLVDALLYAVRYPGSKQLILRRTYPELEKSLIRTVQELYPASLFTYRKSEHSGTFACGSLLDFGYLDNEGDVYKYQSAEYDVIRFDELTHFTEQMYVYLISRCRGVNDFPKHIKSSTNPGGVGHGWVKSRFIDIGEPDKVYNFTSGSRLYLPARVQDNRFLTEKDPNYMRRLKNLSERDQKALLYGCWDIFEGQFFTDWDRQCHTVSPFSIPNGWRKYFTMDYGLDMLAGYLIAVNSQGDAYVYREIYEGRDNGGAGHIVSSAARRIREMCQGEDVCCYYAPPDLWSRQKDSGKSIAMLFAEQGIRLTRAPNNRVAGWLQLKEWLRPVQTESGEVRPRLRIFSNCVNLIRTLPALQYDEKRPEDVSSHPHELTHAPDALRYFVSACPRAPTSSQPTRRAQFSCENQKPSPFGLGERIKVV